MQMNPLQERRPDGRRGRVHEEDRRTQNPNQGSPGLADIIGNSLDRPRDRTESDDGRSLAEIKVKKPNITEEPQDEPITANAADRSSNRVRLFTTHDDHFTVGIGVKGNGKPTPQKFQRPVVSPENMDTLLIKVESTPSWLFSKRGQS
ncbi:hypothetical protein BPOR_0453g00110 [Botrytis porri]|uniref:Uncharacterized protein n=1 Tax=Botrytis porri TaxID=87229 RepID=A0A4Z1KFU1_9HELO|nr:hypothetical protein BPOR_0453g00110 [Botrytis porri]